MELCNTIARNITKMILYSSNSTIINVTTIITLQRIFLVTFGIVQCFQAGSDGSATVLGWAVDAVLDKPNS
jgi:hypothetical protein